MMREGTTATGGTHSRTASADQEDWLTVKEFAARVGMREHSVREAIRKQRLGYRVERLTTGPKGAIRIIVPRKAA